MSTVFRARASDSNCSNFLEVEVASLVTILYTVYNQKKFLRSFDPVEYIVVIRWYRSLFVFFAPDQKETKARPVIG